MRPIIFVCVIVAIILGAPRREPISQKTSLSILALDQPSIMSLLVHLLLLANLPTKNCLIITGSTVRPNFDRGEASGAPVPGLCRQCIILFQAKGCTNTNVFFYSGDGGWSQWIPGSGCSVTCNGGTRQIERECNNPSPSFGGAACQGGSTDTEACNTHPCPSRYNMCKENMMVKL